MSTITFSQEKKQTEVYKTEVNSKTKTIYLMGGIASVITKKDIEFQKKYNIVFHDFGCVAPTNYKEYEEKNALVFYYLNKNFGTAWQKEITKTALGFLEWKNEN